MKKIYLIGLTAMFAFTANAQTTIRIKTASTPKLNSILLITMLTQKRVDQIQFNK